MTLKEIAEANCLDYMTVYSGAMRAGVLKRFRKNVEYDEKEVKVARMTVDRELVKQSLKNKG